MRGIVSGIVFLSLMAGSQRAAADEDIERTRAKLQAIRKQLEELRQQEQTLRKQLAKQEAGKRNAGYIKAEVKGILRYEGVYYSPAVGGPDGNLIKSWTITIEDTKWVLDFGDKKAFLALAKANEGKMVVVTGRVGTRKEFLPPAKNPLKYEPPPPTPTGLSVATFKVAEK
jgi:hypothetical protein